VVVEGMHLSVVVETQVTVTVVGWQFWQPHGGFPPSFPPLIAVASGAGTAGAGLEVEFDPLGKI
jgi:hypothetical protein